MFKIAINCFILYGVFIEKLLSVIFCLHYNKSQIPLNVFTKWSFLNCFTLLGCFSTQNVLIFLSYSLNQMKFSEPDIQSISKFKLIFFWDCRLIDHLSQVQPKFNFLLVSMIASQIFSNLTVPTLIYQFILFRVSLIEII